MNIAELQDELNESDVGSRLASVASSASNIECSETAEDFKSNLEETISECKFLLKELEALKKTVLSRGRK